MAEKQVCHECNGNGQVRVRPGSNFMKSCKTCKGSGFVPYDGRYNGTKAVKTK